jgi:2'-5' RNA ligase
MKRIFIAIKVDPGELFLKILSSFRHKHINDRITWVDPVNTHLTLAFLGNTEEEKIRIVLQMLKEISPGFGAFGFSLAGAGLFRSIQDPRVIWIGIKDQERLAELNALVMKGLINAGFNIEMRPFRPHITLGRIKSINDPSLLKSEIEFYQDTVIQHVAVNEVILYESITLPAGPIYKPIGKFSLS